MVTLWSILKCTTLPENDVATFWATFIKFGLLYIPSSGHTGCWSSGAKMMHCFEVIMSRSKVNSPLGLSFQTRIDFWEDVICVDEFGIACLLLNVIQSQGSIEPSIGIQSIVFNLHNKWPTIFLNGMGNNYWNMLHFNVLCNW